jgi:hypothetical protein
MHVEFVSPEEDIDPENDNADIFIHLDDGRVYAALVATPNNIYRCMDNESIDYYFGEPPLLVRKLTRSMVERAVADLVSQPRWLEVYGTQTGRE